MCRFYSILSSLVVLCCLLIYNFSYLTESAGRLPFTPEIHILKFLWFVSHQSSSYRDVADRFGITISGQFDVITRVTDFLISISPTIIKHPNTEDKNKKQTA